MVVGPNGEFKRIELKGPANGHEWRQSYEVYKISALMLNASGQHVIDQYDAAIKLYWDTYGPELWALLYQADCRMRREFFKTLRRKAAAAKLKGPSHEFDPKRPLQYLFKMALSSEAFWKKQFEHPAMLIRTHIRKLAQDVDGDAKVKNPTASSSTAITAEIDRSTGKRPHNLVEATSSHPAPVKAPLLAITNGPETVNGKGFGFL